MRLINFKKTIKLTTVLLLGVLVSTTVGCKSTAQRQARAKYTVLSELNDSNMQISRSKLTSKVTSVLADFSSGKVFDYKSAEVVEMLSDSEISMMDKKSKVSVKRIDQSEWFVEKGIYKYQNVDISTYKFVDSTMVTVTGKQYMAAYNKAYTRAVRELCSPGDQGIVIPFKKVDASIDSVGVITLKGYFRVYKK
jgi:hypothetical protein